MAAVCVCVRVSFLFFVNYRFLVVVSFILEFGEEGIETLIVFL